MNRARRWALALSIASLMLAGAAPARADVLGSFQVLVDRDVDPAPLVPTTAPRSLRPIDETIRPFVLRRGYAITLTSARGTAALQLQGGVYASMRVALRTFRAARYRPRSTVVRGRRGYLLRRGSARVLLWAEGGVVYYLGTTTAKTVSLGELRATATGLDRLEGYFVGDDGGANSAEVAATSRTVTVDLRFRAPCVLTQTGEGSGSFDGVARVTLVPRQGDGFSFDIASNLRREPGDEIPWQGTVSGTVGANGGTVNLRATGVGPQDSCDTGPLSLMLRPRAR